MKQPLHLRGAAALVTVLLTVSCSKKEDGAAWWQGERERIELGQQLKLKEFRLQSAKSGDLRELEELQVENRNLADSREDLARRMSLLRSEVDSMTNELSEMQVAVIEDQRNRSIGRKFAKMELLSGRTYLEVTIAAIDDSGVTIRHAHGSARLKYGDLSPAQHASFGMDADLAANAAAQEAEDQVAYDQWIGKRLAVIREKERDQAKLAMAAEKKLADERQTLLASIASNTSSSSAFDRPVGIGSSSYESSTYYYNSSPSYRSSYRYCAPSPVYGNRTRQHAAAWSAAAAVQGRSPTPYSPYRSTFYNTVTPSAR